MAFLAELEKLFDYILFHYSLLPITLQRKIGQSASKSEVPPIFVGGMGYYSFDRDFFKIGIGIRTV